MSDIIHANKKINCKIREFQNLKKGISAGPEQRTNLGGTPFIPVREKWLVEALLYSACAALY